MKKRTLVCFLIFTLCVFYTSIPNTVLGQEASLAEQVHEKYSELLGRDDIKAVLPQVLVGLKAPNIQGILSGNPALIGTVVQAPDLLLNFAPDTDPQFIQLLKEDAALREMLMDPQVQSLLADVDAIDELAGLLDVGAEPPTEPVEPPTEPTEPTEPVEPPTEPVEPPTEPTEPVEPPTEPTEPVEPPTEPTEPVEPPTEPVEPPTEPVEPPTEPTEPLPPVEVPPPERFDPIMPTNDYLLHQSRLGGLSLNAVPGRGFIEEIIRTTGLPLGADALVDAIVDLLDVGIFPREQIRQILIAKRLSIFQEEEPHLDYENFGNAITPDFADFAYSDTNHLSTKHLTRNNLQVYMRVPAKVGGVTFNLRNGRTYEGTEVTPDEFQADTIPYTFQLEERVAAGHLPAWPSLSTQQLFSSVMLRYSNSGPDGPYASLEMQSMVGANGVVWETQINIPPGSTFYYFEVVLEDPLALKTLDRKKLAEMFEAMAMGSEPTLAEILSATHTYRIEGWAMPDPRNLQIVDRGIIDALFTDNLISVINEILDPSSPRVGNLIQKALTGQSISVNEFLSLATPRQQNRLQMILGYNTNKIVTKFETAFDPMLASVFTVRRPRAGILALGCKYS